LAGSLWIPRVRGHDTFKGAAADRPDALAAPNCGEIGYRRIIYSLFPKSAKGYEHVT
jgi:hypothetical protein